MLITKPWDIRKSLMIGKCYGCGKKLPKSKAFYCNAHCLNEYLDKMIDEWMK